MSRSCVLLGGQAGKEAVCYWEGRQVQKLYDTGRAGNERSCILIVGQEWKEGVCFLEGRKGKKLSVTGRAGK